MKVLIKGAGDLATGVACRLYNSGFEILMTDIKKPTAVRRKVSFCESMYQNEITVEGIKAKACKDLAQCEEAIKLGIIPVIPDETAKIAKEWKPDAIIDAIIAKTNLGTKITDAQIVVGIGPGFTAGKDCHCVIESQRGHDLGRCIYEGSAIPNTGIPGEIGGFSKERVLKSKNSGIFRAIAKIGDTVSAGQIVAYVNEVPVESMINGILRGLLKDGLNVIEGMKIGDVDPRCNLSDCFSVSDKARSIGGGVMEAIMHLNHIH